MAQAYLLKIPYNYQKEDGCCEVKVLQKYFADLVECVKYLQDIVDKKVVIKGCNDFIEDTIFNKNIPITLAKKEDLESECLSFVIDNTEIELEANIASAMSQNRLISELYREKNILLESLFPVNTLFQYFVTVVTL